MSPPSDLSRSKHFRLAALEEDVFDVLEAIADFAAERYQDIKPGDRTYAVQASYLERIERLRKAIAAARAGAGEVSRK